MSFGGGSQGQIRYQLIIDDAQANQKIGTFKNSLTQLAPATANVNREMGALANNFKGTTGGLTQQNTLIGQMTQQHKSLGTQIKDTSARFSTLAIGISATASSALSLAAGFRDYNDAQIAVERVTRKLSLAHEALTKAQDKLNGLQAKGIKSGKDYQQAQLDVQQAQQAVDIQTQLLGESQERLFDSQTQFVASIVPTVIGAFGTMGAAIREFSGPKGVSGATGALGGLKGAISGLSSGNLGSFLAIAGPIGIAVEAAALLISKLEELKKTVSDAYHEIGLKTVDTSFLTNAKKAVDELNASFNDTNEILKRTGPKSVLDLNFGAKEALQTFKSLGGSIDKTGHAVQTLTDRNIELQPAFKKNGETAATWIHWMEVYLEKSNGAADILGKLKKANFDDATAKKIAAAAYEDYFNKLKVGAPLIQSTAKATENLTTKVNALDSGVKQVAMSLWDFLDPAKKLRLQLEENTKSTDKINNSNQTYLAWFLKLDPAQQQFIKNLEKGNTTAQTAIITTQKQREEHEKLVESHILGSDALEDEIQGYNDFAAAVDHATPFLDKMRETAKKTADEFASFANESKLKLQAEFGIKDPDKQADKLVKKFINKIEDKSAAHDLKMRWKIETKNQAFEQAAGTIISGMKDFIETDDTLADAVAKQLIKEAPDTEDGRRMKNFLNNAIKDANTGEILTNNLQKDMNTGKYILKIPVQGVWQGFGNTRQTAGIDFDTPSGGSGENTPSALTDKELQNMLDKGNKNEKWNAFISKYKKSNAYRQLLNDYRGGGDYSLDEFPTYDFLYNNQSTNPAEAQLLNPSGRTSGGGLPYDTLQNQGMSKRGFQLISAGGQTLGQDQLGQLVKANPLDVFARQLVQITKDLSTFARAIVQVTKDNNLFARTITTITADNNQLARTVVTITADNNQLARTTAQLIKNNNVYAQTVVQVTDDHNQLARTIVTMVKDNNQFAKTQVQLTKNNNTYAQTVVQVTKDHNQLAKTQVQLTKNNNTLARTIVQVGKDFSKAAGDAKDFAKALIAVAAAAKKARSATGGSSTGGGTEMAQHGMHKTLAQDTMILAHKGERVDIGPGSGGDGTGGISAGTNGTIVVNLTNVNSDRETTRVFRRKLGENQFRFGPR